MRCASCSAQLTASTVTTSRSTSKWWRSIGSVVIVNTIGAGVGQRRWSRSPRGSSPGRVPVASDQQLAQRADQVVAPVAAGAAAADQLDALPRAAAVWWSRPTAPNSLTITAAVGRARRAPARSSEVLPEPRKPPTTRTGMRAAVLSLLRLASQPLEQRGRRADPAAAWPAARRPPTPRRGSAPPRREPLRLDTSDVTPVGVVAVVESVSGRSPATTARGGGPGGWPSPPCPRARRSSAPRRSARSRGCTQAATASCGLERGP